MSGIVKKALTYFSKKKYLRCLVCNHEQCPGCLDWCDTIFFDDDNDDWVCCQGACIYHEDDDGSFEYWIYMKNLDRLEVMEFLDDLKVKADWDLDDEECPSVIAYGSASNILKVHEKYKNYSLSHEISNPFCKKD